MGKKDPRIDAIIAKSADFAKPKPSVEPPQYFLAALRKDKKAWATSDATRDKRLETAVAWMAEGKTRLWKYSGI
ncbi:MAG TPA: hypothetical protein VJ385_16065 [Fibrobacteria bacterium]|nr:hypothetical protein [Fibrobacteria bacterium]